MAWGLLSAVMRFLPGSREASLGIGAVAGLLAGALIYRLWLGVFVIPDLERDAAEAGRQAALAEAAAAAAVVERKAAAEARRIEGEMRGESDEALRELVTGGRDAPQTDCQTGSGSVPGGRSGGLRSCP